MDQFDDLNPCTGETITFTFTGIATVQEFDDHFILVASGTVLRATDSLAVSTGIRLSGRTGRSPAVHAMEVSDETRQRIIFGVGVVHETSVDGEPVVSFTNLIGLTCVSPKG